MRREFNDYGPIWWIRRQPVYLTTVFCALMVTGMFVTVVLNAAHLDCSPLMFSTADFWLRGRVWQILTYPFIELPGFFFLFNVLFFYMAGVEVEKFIGRVRFMQLYALLTLLPVLFWAAVSLAVREPVGGSAGAQMLTIAMFIAFATLYPDVEWWGWIPLKWFAAACLLLQLMMLLPDRLWLAMGVLTANCLAAFGYIRWVKRGGSLEWMRGFFGNPFRRKPKFRVVPRPRDGKPPRVTGDDPIESIDPLLDKIATHGLKSLTARERERLESASAALAKRPPDR